MRITRTICKEFFVKHKLVIAIILLIVLLGGIAGGVAAAVISNDAVLDDTSFLTEPNLLKKATYLSNNSTDKKANLVGDGKSIGVMEITLAQAVTINTLVFYEPTENVTDYEVYAGDTLIYKQQEMGPFRYATFTAVTTDKLTLKVLSAFGDYTINKIEGFLIERPRNDFRMVSYLTLNSLFSSRRVQDPTDSTKMITEYDKVTVQDPTDPSRTIQKYVLKDNLDWSSFTPVTDLILFGGVRITKDGTLVDNGMLDSALPVLREKLTGQNTRFLLSVLEADSIPTKQDVYNAAFGTNREVSISNIVAYLEARDLDGVDFDYEYPLTNNDWEIYNGFLVAMKKALPDTMLLSAATTYYDLFYSNEALRALDYVNIMGYDGYDKYGNHAGFKDTAVDAFSLYNTRKALLRNKINLGVPFYSRPGAVIDGNVKLYATWLNYSMELNWSLLSDKKLTKWDNFATYAPYVLTESGGAKTVPDNTLRSFNGCQMIADKTALAYDYGAGGIMIWNHACDTAYSSELSLMRAFNEVFSA